MLPAKVLKMIQAQSYELTHQILRNKLCCFLHRGENSPGGSLNAVQAYFLKSDGKSRIDIPGLTGQQSRTRVTSGPACGITLIEQVVGAGFDHVVG